MTLALPLILMYTEAHVNAEEQFLQNRHYRTTTIMLLKYMCTVGIFICFIWGGQHVLDVTYPAAEFILLMMALFKLDATVTDIATMTGALLDGSAPIQKIAGPNPLISP